jgi:hypothetical protein
MNNIAKLQKNIKINYKPIRKNNLFFNNKTEFVPVFNISGKYLEKLGFKIGTLTKVTFEDNKIIIEKL